MVEVKFYCGGDYAVIEIANAGVAEEIRMRVVGHKLKSVHQTYTHLDMAVLKAAVEKIGWSTSKKKVEKMDHPIIKFLIYFYSFKGGMSLGAFWRFSGYILIS